MHDRTYWRMEDNSRLIAEARDSDHELCIALGERLEQADIMADGRLEEAIERARDAEIDANRLDDKVYELRVEIDKLEMMLGQRDDRIAELEEQLKKGN